MNILCVIDNLGSGGAQRQLVELAIGFKDKGNEVSLLTYRNSPFFNPYLERAGILINCIEEPNYFKRFFKMRNFIRHGNFDSILSFLELPNLICEVSGLPFRKWKLVVGERSADPSIKKSLKLKMYRWFHLFADYVVANSYCNKELVHSVCGFLSKDKVKVIYNIVDFDQFNPLANFNFKKCTKLKLVVSASHHYRKNLHGLIDALALLSEDELDKIEVDWYGDRLTEPYYDCSFPEAKQKIAEMKLEKLISFYPATNEIANKIKNADAIGLFSFIEGLPNMVCEGMACAKPIICPYISDLPELLTFDENLFCEPGDPQSIKRAISYLINLTNDQLFRIGAENKKISKNMFAKEMILSDYLKLLSK